MMFYKPNGIFAYPCLDEQLLQVLQPDVSFYFSYPDGQPLEYEQWGDEIHIKSPIWTPLDFGLKVEMSIVLKKVNCLFENCNQMENQAVAPEDATLELAVHWRIPELRLQGIVRNERAEIKSSDDTITLSFTLHFPKAQIRRKLVLRPTLYLKQPGQNRGMFADLPGTILGVLTEFKLITGGAEGVFPIFNEKNGEKKALWRVEICISEDDDLDEDFDENFKLFINEDHQDYDKVWALEEGLSPLGFEIFCSACAILLKRVCQLDGFKMDFQDNETVPDIPSVQTWVRNFINLHLLRYSKKEIADMRMESLAVALREALFDLESKKSFS